MGRSHTFHDREFGRGDFDPEDHGTFEQGLVFVVMPFHGEGMDEAFSAIKDECTKLRLNAKRADENIGSGFILKEITENIENAEFIVVDLTYERPNVYYELGYAHGVGNEGLDILLIAKEGTSIHFDITPMRIYFYESTENLRSIIYTGLRAMIKATRNI